MRSERRGSAPGKLQFFAEFTDYCADFNPNSSQRSFFISGSCTSCYILLLGAVGVGNLCPLGLLYLLISTPESAALFELLGKAGRDFGREDGESGTQLLLAVPSPRSQGPGRGRGRGHGS